MSILHSTDNILDIYMYATGESEIPKTWLKWVCISTVAASLADRVWFQKLAWKVLHPNLYVMLIGKSGVGKGAAIDFGLQFRHERINMLRGSATKQSLMDRMCQPVQEGAVPNSKIFIVQDELAEAVGHSSIANTYIKAMTAWYSITGGEIEENTRTHGKRVVEESICINWLSGTTVEWLQDAMDYKSMMSGGFGRICTIPGAYDYEKRMYLPESVPDYYNIINYLRDRFEELTCMEGEFEMLPAARELDEEWFYARDAPQEGMEPFWMREPVLVLKLAMIMSACDSMDRIIRVPHILAAHDLVREIKGYMPKVIQQSAQGGMTTAMERMMNFIAPAKNGVTRSELSKFLSRWGIKASEINSMTETLLEQEKIVLKKRMQKTVYFAKTRPAIIWDDIIGA